MRPMAALWICLGALLPAPAQTGPGYIPPPLRVRAPYPSAWEAMQATLEQQKLKVAREDRTEGYIVTDFVDLISGVLTESRIRRVGEQPKLIDGEWTRVRYTYEVLVEPSGTDPGRETVITVYANIQALKREYLGGESWVKITTRGVLEATLLTRFGRFLFGDSFNLDKPRKGYWERDPTYIPDLHERIPRIVGPERP